MTRREIAVKIAWAFYGIPYRWGGDDPMAGFDCSGMIVEILKSVGLLPYHGDWTADGLFRKFREKWVSGPYAGCLVFWGDERKHHIELCINPSLSIGAGGGRSTTTSLDSAIRYNAFIRVRPFRGRSGSPLSFVDPFLRDPS